MGNWFDTDTKKGKVTLEQQLTGLGLLKKIVPGKTVFDLGCAEGQIAAQVMAWGAISVDGVDNRFDAVAHAVSLGVNAIEGDANEFQMAGTHDVVLLLGILHKLKNPAETLRRMLSACKETCAIRLPCGQWPVLRDSRSGGDDIDLLSVATDEGFVIFAEAQGPHGQWVGYLRRAAD
jgi:SAM-dependent methyltransferase